MHMMMIRPAATIARSTATAAPSLGFGHRQALRHALRSTAFGASQLASFHSHQQQRPHLNPSQQSPSLEQRRSLHVSSLARDFHFDTHHFVQRLEREGLTRAQSEGIMASIADVIDESIRNLTQNMVSKSQQEKFHYTQKVDFAQLKSEMQLVEKNDLALMKAENDRLMNEVDKLKQRLREEITRSQAGFRLDLNLEKGRIRDETSVQEIKIREVDTRIETEIAGLRTAIETAKQSTLQYLVTVATGCAALLMAYLRFRV